jgi:hypothetical protein
MLRLRRNGSNNSGACVPEAISLLDNERWLSMAEESPCPFDTDS